jgi:drug/metabolite transporter (DMT)-like permease
MLGVMILCRVEELNFSNRTFFGDCLILIYCISYGSFLGLSKNFFAQYDRIWITGWLFALATLGLTAVTASQWQAFQWPDMTPYLWFTTIYGVIFSGVIGYFLMIWVVAHAPASQVALFDYLQPVLVTLLTWYFLTEKITTRTCVGGALIVLGVGLSLEWGDRKLRRPRRVDYLERQTA